MERIIVSISRPGQGELDLEVPVDLPSSVLIQEMALALGWDIQGGLYADPPGRVMAPSETFAQAGVWDGARLLLQSPVDSQSQLSSLSTSPQGEGPVRDWRPLDLGQTPASAPDTPSPSGGFVWKRVDED